MALSPSYRTPKAIVQPTLLLRGRLSAHSPLLQHQLLLPTRRAMASRRRQQLALNLHHHRQKAPRLIMPVLFAPPAGGYQLHSRWRQWHAYFDQTLPRCYLYFSLRPYYSLKMVISTLWTARGLCIIGSKLRTALLPGYYTHLSSGFSIILHTISLPADNNICWSPSSICLATVPMSATHVS